jgi:nicotinamide-nucleotide amidase
MKAEIITIGTELLLGEITDTNSAYLASELPQLGLDLHFISTVGDNQKRIIETLKLAWQRSDIIIITGGLGPTQDDVTREAIAEFLGEQITIDDELVRRFEELFRRYGMEMPRSNIKQAAVIPSAKIIPNPRGTAPGWWIEKDNRVIVTMPGPPGEMQLMWTTEVFPRLKQIAGGQVIVSRTLKTFGLTEAEVDERVSKFLSSTNPTLATYAKRDGIYLRITAKAQSESEAWKLISEREADVRSILGSYVWGVDSDSLEEVVGALLKERGLTIATAELYTGGLLASVMAGVPDSEVYFKGGLVAGKPELVKAFGVSPGLVDGSGGTGGELAEAMASATRSIMGASVGFSLIGVTGSEESGNKAAGTIFIGIDSARRRGSFRGKSLGNRVQARHRAVIWALFELRKVLLEEARCT